jgi:soluble lytic murein transglycosylase-like protein
MIGGSATEVPDCIRETAQRPPRLVRAMPVTSTRIDFRPIALRSIFELVHKMVQQYQVAPQLTLAIIAAESNFDSLALSPKNVQGLMQLTPQTSACFYPSNAFDPAQNIRSGLSYLRWLLAYFQGDVALVAAAYNAGEGRVKHYQEGRLIWVTRAYIQRILNAMGTPTHPFDASVTRPSPALALIRPLWLVK